jgi:hypothetical protein
LKKVVGSKMASSSSYPNEIFGESSSDCAEKESVDTVCKSSGENHPKEHVGYK